ncbi:MAG: hypothetical protein LBJ70_04505, partial [Holosporales bacterium]|nr:hypothetical protein [Holosporales bacterium]
LTNGPNPDFIDYKGLLSGYEISIPRFFLRVPLAKFFPEAVVPTRWTDRPKRWGFYVLCIFCFCKHRDSIRDYYVYFLLFLRHYPTLRKFQSLDISHVKTYKNMEVED